MKLGFGLAVAMCAVFVSATTLSTAVEAASRRVTLAEARYRAGATSRLELLDAQRQLYGGQLALLGAQAAQSSASIALYRALGGGPKVDGDGG